MNLDIAFVSDPENSSYRNSVALKKIDTRDRATYRAATYRAATYRACIQPGEDTSGLSKSDRTIKTLTVHHRNYKPEDNRPENLIAVCTGCHLGYHQRRRGNVSPGQLSLW